MTGRSARGRRGVPADGRGVPAGGRGPVRGRAYSAPRNASIGSTSTAPSTLPSSSGAQQEYQCLPRTGNTAFQQQAFLHQEQQYSQPQQFPRTAPEPSDYDPILGSYDTGPILEDSWNVEDLLDETHVDETQEEEVDPTHTIETILAAPGRAERLPVVNPAPDAPPDTIWILGRDPKSGISRRLTKIMCKTFDGPWYSWKKYPAAHKDRLIFKFASWFHWDYSDHAEVEKMVLHQANKRFNDLVYALKTKRMEPTFIKDEHWKVMTDYWAAEDTKKRSEKYSKNRKSDRGGVGMAKHTGGSKCFDQHETDMSIKAGRRVSVHEVFRATHMKAGEFVDKLAEKVVQTYEEAKEQHLSQLDPELTSDGRTQTPVLTQDQEDEIFIQAASSVRPSGPAYGIPKRRALSSDGSGGSRPSGWTSTVDAELAELKESNAKLQEDMRRMAEKRAQDDAAMERVRKLLEHPEMLRLAASLDSQPSSASDSRPDPPTQQ